LDQQYSGPIFCSNLNSIQKQILFLLNSGSRFQHVNPACPKYTPNSSITMKAFHITGQ